MKKLFTILPFLGLVTLLFTSCGSDLNDNNANGKSQVGFYLTDAPIVKGYKAVNIDVKSISFSTDSIHWVNLPIAGKVVEITKFANGKAAKRTKPKITNSVPNSRYHLRSAWS